MGIIINHFDSKFIYSSDDSIYASLLNDFFGDHISEYEDWYTLNISDLNSIILRLHSLIKEYLNTAGKTFEPSFNSDVELIFEGRKYRVNLRSNEGRIAKFSLKLFHVLNANLLSGYNVKIRKGDQELSEKLRRAVT